MEQENFYIKSITGAVNNYNFSGRIINRHSSINEVDQSLFYDNALLKVNI